jgi:hypothetical protein
MTTLTIKDLPHSEELDEKALRAIHGGRMKLPFQRDSGDDLLIDPTTGGPVIVIVDGVVQNSVATGFAPR